MSTYVTGEYKSRFEVIRREIHKAENVSLRLAVDSAVCRQNFTGDRLGNVGSSDDCPIAERQQLVAVYLLLIVVRQQTEKIDNAEHHCGLPLFQLCMEKHGILQSYQIISVALVV